MTAASLTLDLVVDADVPALTGTAYERPTRINIANAEETQQRSSSRDSSTIQQQLASPTTPTSATLSPSGSAIMSPISASFLPEMPQWKKDLIQRRKTNAARNTGAGAGVGGTHSPLLSPQQQQLFRAGHESDGSLSPTKDFSSLKSMQYTAKASKNTIKTTTTTITNQTTSQQQQQHLLIQHQQQHITAEEQQLQQKKIAKPNVIKTPATHTATSEENQQQQSEEDVDPVISPTTKEEIAEKFIGGHSTPQVSMDPSTAAEVETSATPYNAAPIPKQRSLFVAPIKLLSTEEPDSCTNSSATASPSPSSSLLSATRLTSSSSSSPTATMVAAITKEQQQHHQQQQQQQLIKQQTIIKGKVEKVEPATDAELHEAVFEAEEEELVAETTTITTTKTSNRHTHTCGTYLSSPSTTSTSTPPPTAIVGKSTTSLSSSCGSSHIQSYSSNESEKSFTATTTTTFGTNALLSTSNTTTAATSKKFDIDKFEKSSPKISTKLQSNQFIKNQAVCNNSGAAAAAPGGGGGVPVTTKYIKFRSTQDSNDCSQTTKTTVNAAIKKKMVAVQEMKKTTTSTNHHISTTTTMCTRQSQSHAADFDASEDLSYGPGIVSKLRCRYLSLALRESMEKQRHALDTLRRATSLNNLLDRDDQLRKHAEDDEDEDEEDANGDDVNIEDDYGEDQENLPPRPATGGILRGTHDGQQANVTKKTATFQKYASAANAHARMSQSQGDGGAAPGDNSANKRSRHIKRGNDSLKRARSVEALLCEKSPWNFAYNRSSLEPPRQPLPASNRGGAIINVTIEDKINNARERLVLGTEAMPPRRLTSIIDDTERPPPDLVKQTLKKFEATANRRGRGVNRAQGNGDVASKVANYRSIIKEQKPAIVFPKPPAPPLSPTKKAAVKLAAKAPVLGAADLIGSPIGRKTAAVAATTTSATVGSPLSGGFPPQFTETSTPKQKLQSVPADVLAFTPPIPLKNVTALSGAVVGGGVGLSENSPDIIPRHNINKLLSETAAAGGVVVVDSPVTALTKKLEKLRIEADKQAEPQSQQQQHVIAKEFQAKPNQQQQQQQQQEQQHDLTAGSDKFVGGDAALLAADKHHNSNGTRNKNNKNKSIGDDGGDSDKNTNDDDDDGGDDSDDVHDDYDFVHDRCAEAESAKAGTGSASSDLSDDEYGTVTTTTTKRVSKKALDNIAKAGTSQEFKFATKTITTSTTTELLKTTATGKQIGIIRPLHQVPASTTNSSSSSSSSSSLTYSSNSSNESFTTAKSSTNSNNQQQQQHMETLRNHQQQTYTLSHTNTHTINTHTHAHHHHPHPALTSREIEKNRINEMKKTATVAAAAAANNAAAATDIATAAHTTATTSLDTVIVTGGSSSSSKVSSLSELDAAATITHNSSPLWALQTKKKRQPPAVVAENNSMVFNFSNRKEVPDYIENDGVVIRRKRELPKPNESGFVLLGDLSLETSTDSDYDDFSLCPPSPCDVEFENANIVIDGKSSIRQKPKEATFRVQFNDTLTSTFEYPSEASLVVDDSISDRYANENFVHSYENLVLEPAASLIQTDSPKYHHHHVAVDEIIPIPINSTTGTTNSSTPTTKMLGSLPLGSAPLGCYTPVKAPIDNLFQLGVTRAPNGNGISHNTTTNGNGTAAAPTANGGNNVDNNDGSINNMPTITPTTNDEPESLQYLKPANDDLTIAYSEGAQKTDLLY